MSDYCSRRRPKYDAEKLGLKSHFIDGLRVTDVDAMEVVEMVLSGKVNQRLVAAINVHSDKGIGLSGKDGSLLRAKSLSKDAKSRTSGRGSYCHPPNY